MADDLKTTLVDLVQKVDIAKWHRLDELVDELKSYDELLGHNAEVARDQLKTKAEPILDNLSAGVRKAILEVAPRITAESLLIAERLIRYGFPAKVVLFLHLDDFLDPANDIPMLLSRTTTVVQRFLTNNPTAHMVVMSHDSADVVAVLVSALAGQLAIASGQVSMIYESGLGMYIGGERKQKRDSLGETRTEVLHVLERMAIAAATRITDKHFKERFYFTATEYSIGIRVHPYARGLSTTMDKEAAHELVSDMAVALADLVKEDVKAVENRIINYFLSLDSGLSQVFSQSNDERVWDMEKVNQLITMFRFVHMGSRGSIIRPAESTDVAAAQILTENLASDTMTVVASDSPYSKPLLEWALERKSNLIACSDGASRDIRDLVETRGGIEYASGHIDELLACLDAFLHLKPVVK